MCAQVLDRASVRAADKALDKLLAQVRGQDLRLVREVFEAAVSAAGER